MAYPISNRLGGGRGEGAGVGVSTYNFDNFPQKLHTIDQKKLDGGTPSAFLDLPMKLPCNNIINYIYVYYAKKLVVKSVPALFAVLSLVLCFESENKCNDFMLVAMRMLRYSASRHFSRVRCTFSFLQNF